MLDHHHQEQGSQGVLCADTDAVLDPLRVQVGNSLQRCTANEDKDDVGRSPNSSCRADQVSFDHLCGQDIAYLKVDETSGTTFVEQLDEFDECDMLSLLELIQDPLESFMQHNASTVQQIAAPEFQSHDDNNSVAQGQTTMEIRDPLQRKKRNQNQSRARQRQEVRLLRDYVKELEAQRNKLFEEYTIYCKNSNFGEDATKHDKYPAQPTKEAIFQRALALKRSVERTKQEAERARVENLRLRGLIEQQCRVTRKFEADFRAKNELCTLTAAELASVNFTLPSPVLPQPVYQPADLSSTPECLEKDLDAQYQQLGSIWGTCGFTDQPPQSCSAKTLDGWYHQKQDEQGNRVWENTHSRVLPFSPESVVRAIWECLSREIQTPSGGELKIGKTSGDTIEILFRDTYPKLGQVAHRSSSSSASVRLSVRIMLKKFVKANRIVLVQSSVIDIEAEKCRRVRLHGKGWSVLQCLGVQGRSSKDQLAPCFAQACVRIVPAARPEDDGTLNGGEASFSTIPLEFIANHRQIRDFVQQLIENQIIDECLRSLASPK